MAKFCGTTARRSPSGSATSPTSTTRARSCGSRSDQDSAVGKSCTRRSWTGLYIRILESVGLAEVKKIADLSPRDIERESPELRSIDDVIEVMSRIYGDFITPQDTVTVIYFSRVDE